MLEIKHKNGRRWLTDGEATFPLKGFEECRSRYVGGVFLLASGPSAASFPLARYADQAVLAMNGSIVRCIDDGITPEFYLCDDPSFVAGRPWLALEGIRHARHVAMSLDCLREVHARDPRALAGRSLYLLERVNRMHGQAVLSDRAYAWSIRKDADLICGFSLFRSKPNRIGFSLDMGKGYFGARTIPYAALQLSCHLGFDRVFIVGMDLSKSLGRFYEQGEKALPSTLDEDFEDYILPSFRLVAEKVLSRHGLRLFNVSAASRLPASVVPKIDLAQLDLMLAPGGETAPTESNNLPALGKGAVA